MPADVKVTYKEYSQMPETGPRYQLIGGELHLSPSPNFRHQRILWRLVAAMEKYLAGHPLGEAVFAPLDVILTDEDVMQPDLVFVSTARKNLIVPQGVRGGPDLCVEVLSESTAALDRGAKRKLCALHGVIEYWIVDPEKSGVEVYRLQVDAEHPMRTFSGADVLTSELFPGFKLKLKPLFA